MVAALNLEPYVLKKGAVNVEENTGRKRFEDFILSSSVLAGMELSKDCYLGLRKTMEQSVKLLGKTRMWGAMELLFPWAWYKESKEKKFVDYLKTTDTLDVTNMDIARCEVWGTSQKDVKKAYTEEGFPGGLGNNIFQHYETLLRWGEKVESEMVTVWCQEILDDLPTVKRMQQLTRPKNMAETIEMMPAIWEMLIGEGKFSVGQLADYTVLVLYDKVMERVK